MSLRLWFKERYQIRLQVIDAINCAFPSLSPDAVNITALPSLSNFPSLLSEIAHFEKAMAFSSEDMFWSGLHRRSPFSLTYRDKVNIVEAQHLFGPHAALLGLAVTVVKNVFEDESRTLKVLSSLQAIEKDLDIRVAETHAGLARKTDEIKAIVTEAESLVSDAPTTQDMALVLYSANKHLADHFSKISSQV